MIGLLRIAGTVAAESLWLSALRRRWAGAFASIASAVVLIALGGAFLVVAGFVALSEAIGAKLAALAIGGTLVLVGGIIELVRQLRRRRRPDVHPSAIIDALAAAGSLGALGERHDVERAWSDFRRTVSVASPLAIAAAMIGLLVGLVSVNRPPQSS